MSESNFRSKINEDRLQDVVGNLQYQVNITYSYNSCGIDGCDGAINDDDDDDDDGDGDGDDYHDDDDDDDDGDEFMIYDDD